MSTDIRVESHGSIYLLRAQNPEAGEWLDANLDPDVRYLGGACVVEPRYVAGVVAGAREAGLEVR